jgi:hypothetical protein
MKDRTKSIERLKREVESLNVDIESALSQNSPAHADRLRLIRDIKKHKLNNYIRNN